MKKVEYRLNDYVINEDNKICRVVGTGLYSYAENITYPSQSLTLLWREVKGDKPVMHVDVVDASKVRPWSFNLAILTAIGFKQSEGMHTVVYRDAASRRSIVIDRLDGSVYVFLSSRHIMMDFVLVDAVHEIQHVFDAADVEFPNLSSWLFIENAKRKPPVKLHET